jgi:hypothetical protein
MVDKELDEVASGEDEDSYWITLGFSSQEVDLDTLHIVCGKEEDLHPGFQGLYLERFDQGMSDYELTRSVTVFPDAIEISLNERGSQILKMPGLIRFRPTARLTGSWQNALQTFRKMAATPNGGDIDFVA